jgi:hypothetical protein
LGAQALAAYLEVQVDAGENLGVGIGTLGGEFNVAPGDLLTAFAKDQHHIIGSTSARTK